MARHAGGNAAQSYSQVVTEGGNEAGGKHFKKPSRKVLEARGKETIRRNESQDQEGNQQETSKEKEKGGNSGKMTSTRTTGVCKPKSSIIPRVILSDPVIQAHKDHEITCNHFQVHGVMANGEGFTRLDLEPLEAKGRNTFTSRF